MEEDKILEAARTAHEVNRVYCASIGDHNQLPWDEAPTHVQESVVDGVRYHLANPDAGPSGSHENWLKFKLADGWVYGPVKDFEKKTHPCLLPYDQLPEAQRIKDAFFVAVGKGIFGK